jgi:hypothetical protein
MKYFNKNILICFSILILLLTLYIINKSLLKENFFAFSLNGANSHVKEFICVANPLNVWAFNKCYRTDTIPKNKCKGMDVYFDTIEKICKNKPCTKQTQENTLFGWNDFVARVYKPLIDNNPNNPLTAEFKTNVDELQNIYREKFKTNVDIAKIGINYFG